MTTEISRVYTEELLALCHIFDKYDNFYEDLKILLSKSKKEIDTIYSLQQISHDKFGIYSKAVKDFYENDELIAITKELTDTLRKNKTIDWQLKEQARAKMKMMIKRLLKKHHYPPESEQYAIDTIMTQCEIWTDNVMDG